MPGRLLNKVVLISGTGSGMGRATARLFASEGAIVAGCDLDSDAAAETERIIANDGFTIDTTAPVDLTNREQAHAWVDGAASRHGGVDVLYNNAGLTRFGPIESQSSDDYEFTIANELDQVWSLCQITWPHLRARRGVIVNIASVAGIIGSRHHMESAHSAAKGAVIALSRQLAAEGAAAGIRVNSISPGAIGTPTLIKIVEELGDDAPFMGLVAATFNGELGDPMDIAYAGLYLASDEAKWVTGVNLVVDGGATVLI